MPKKNIASAMKISRMALWKIEQNHKEYGEDGLKDHKPGRLFEPLSRNFYDLVIEYWKKYKCGARKLYAILKNKGFKVSLRKISQVLVREGYQKPCLPRRKTRNSSFALYNAIAENLVAPFILNSDRGTQFFPNKKDKNGKAIHEFQDVLEELGIIFVPSKRRHPQTNGKLEKFFHILDTEFDERF